MRLAVCIATRGTLHSRTIESVLWNVNQVSKEMKNVKLFFTHDLPIPEAQNTLVSNALKWNPDYVWMVEEDVFVPGGALKKMLKDGGDIVAVDYPVGEKQWGCVCIKKGEILWTGIGCTLIKAEVFRKMKGDWFETKRSVRITNLERMEYVIDENVPYKYGGLDILFGIKARELGYKISQIEGLTATHMKVVQTGDSGANKGTHKIKFMDKILNYQVYK